MRALITLLISKILLTAVAVCIPLLFFSPELLQRLGFLVPEATLFLRLLGIAYLALLVSYAFGVREARRGIYPAAIVWVGIVSNTGACLILSLAAVQGSWAHWGQLARLSMFGAQLGTAGIAAGLLYFGPCRAKHYKIPSAL